MTREWVEPVVVEAPSAPTPVQASEEVSPAHQPHEMFFSRDHASNRMKMMGGSSSACLTQSLNLFLRRAGIRPVSEPFRHGMRHAEEFQIPLEVGLPDFPDITDRKRYIDVYFDRIHRLWPIYDIDQMKTSIHQFAESGRQNLTQEIVPTLVSAYLIMSIGADEEAQCSTKEGYTYMQAAAGLLTHVVFVPYLSSVQALLMYVIVCRGRNKDGVAWQIIGMAIRIAQSIGLHRHSVNKPSQDHGVTRKQEQLFHSRIWAVCCCMEKLMQLESGRPSAFGGVTRDQMMGQEQRPPGLDYLQWNMGIAGIQEHISAHIYSHRPGERTSQQILLDTARFDKALLDWANELPPDFHPANDLFCDDKDFHIAAFLSIQYHQAMIALYRAGLIAPSDIFEAEVDKQCGNEPSRFRLKGAESICIKSARAIARITMELADRRIGSRILTAGPPLLACIVIAIYLTKLPKSRMQASDLELLKACAQQVEEQYVETGQDERFAHVAVAIYEAVKRYIDIVQKSASVPKARRTLNEGQPTMTSSPQSIIIPPPAYDTISASNRLSSKGADVFPENGRELRSSDSIPTFGNGSIVADSFQPLLQQPPSMVNDNIDIGPLPFDDYNVEDLWNWMLQVDNNESPFETMSSNHIAYI